MNRQRVLAMVRKDLKHTMREPASLFIILLFPVMLTIVFGVTFGGVGGSGATTYQVGIVNLNGAAPSAHWSSDLVANLTATQILQTKTYPDNATARADLQVGNVQAVVVIPADFGASCDAYRAAPENSSAWIYTSLALSVDQGSMVATQAIPPIVNQALARTLEGNVHASSALPISVGSPSLVAVARRAAFDYLVPGLFAYGAIFITMTVGGSFSADREDGRLRRLNTTPLTPSEFMTSQVMSNMVLGVAQVGLVFVVAFANGYRPSTDLAGLALAFVLVSVLAVACVGFGLITATLAKSSSAATGIAFLFILPQMFLGTFVSGMAPSAVTATAGRFVPAYYVTDALTNLFLRGVPASNAVVLGDLGMVSLASVLVLAVGIVLFRRFGNE
jgi:ABC-type multidrug transport system permease subunit